MKPTSGWVTRARYTGRSPRVERVDIVDEDGQVMGSVLADDTEQVENCTILEVVSKAAQKRAVLFAATPDLLQAGESAVKRLERMLELKMDSMLRSLVELALRDLRAAIAKAKKKG